MQRPLFLALAASTVSTAIPFVHQHHHHHVRQSVPANPISVSSADYLCDVTSDLPVVRDLGFVGKIQDTTIYTYGDTMTTSGSFYMTSDSSSIGTDDPCHVLNTQRTADGSHQTNMVPWEAKWGENNAVDAFGGTNVVPTGGNGGMMFFLKNHRPNGVATIIGAGVASVSLSEDKNVTTSRLAEYWWDGQAGEPWYGDVGAYTDGNYVWGYGHGGPNHDYVFLTRALVTGWTELKNWEYYDGSTHKWSNTRLYNPTADQALQWNAVDGNAWAVDQGQMIWSEHYQKIVWVYTIDWADDAAGQFGVYARTADRPRGPWSHATELYKVERLTSDDSVYCAVANPYFDSTGKSIVVTVDNGSSHVQATKVIFD